MSNRSRCAQTWRQLRTRARGKRVVQRMYENGKFLNCWMHWSILFLTNLKLFSFQLLFVLKPFVFQHQTQDLERRWHL